MTYKIGIEVWIGAMQNPKIVVKVTTDGETLEYKQVVWKKFWNCEDSLYEKEWAVLWKSFETRTGIRFTDEDKTKAFDMLNAAANW
jgi:hypothetical protein